MELPGGKSIFLRRYNIFDYIRDMMAAKRLAYAAIFVPNRCYGEVVETVSKPTRNRDVENAEKKILSHLVTA